jgi:hypothetical protein
VLGLLNYRLYVAEGNLEARRCLYHLSARVGNALPQFSVSVGVSSHSSSDTQMNPDGALGENGVNIMDIDSYDN